MGRKSAVGFNISWKNAVCFLRALSRSEGWGRRGKVRNLRRRLGEEFKDIGVQVGSWAGEGAGGSESWKGGVETLSPRWSNVWVWAGRLDRGMSCTR